MRIKFFKTEIFVTFTFSAFLALLLVIDRTGYLIPVFCAIILHELGHLISMVIISCAPKKIVLKPFHIDMSGFVIKSHKEKGIIASTGLISNVFFFFLFYLIYKLYFNNYILIYAAANLAVFIINALPCLGLDGGDLLFLFLNLFFNKDKSMFILKIISLIIAGAIFVVAFYMVLNLQKNISIFIFGIYIIICTFLAKGEV